MEIRDTARHDGLGRTIVHRRSEPGIFAEVIPFGRYGAGLWTGHPVGLVIALGLFVMVLAGIPEARWFLAGVLILGALWGFFLWLRHR